MPAAADGLTQISPSRNEHVAGHLRFLSVSLPGSASRLGVRCPIQQELYVRQGTLAPCLWGSGTCRAEGATQASRLNRWNGVSDVRTIRQPRCPAPATRAGCGLFVVWRSCLGWSVQGVGMPSSCGPGRSWGGPCRASGARTLPILAQPWEPVQESAWDCDARDSGRRLGARRRRCNGEYR